MSSELETIAVTGVLHGEDERVWADHAESLLTEMDGTTPELFASAVRRNDCRVLIGLAMMYERCETKATRAKALEGIMSVCALVPEAYDCFLDSHRAFGRLVLDASETCADCSGEGDDPEASMCKLYAVVLLGQIAEHLLVRVESSTVCHAPTLLAKKEEGLNDSLEELTLQFSPPKTTVLLPARGPETKPSEAPPHDLALTARTREGLAKILIAGVVPGLLSCLDSDAPEMILAASSALITLNALARLSGGMKGQKQDEWTGGGGPDGGCWFWQEGQGHRNLRFFGETVLNLLNRSGDFAAETRRQLLMVLVLLERGEILYFNDIRVLVDVCLRGLVEEGGSEEGKGEQEVRADIDEVACKGLYIRVLEQVVLLQDCALDPQVCGRIAGTSRAPE